MIDIKATYLRLLSTADLNNPQHLSILQDFRYLYKNQLEAAAPALLINGHQPIAQSATKPADPNKNNAYHQVRRGRQPKYTYASVIDAVKKTKTLKDAGKLLNLKDPNYIYELARKYNIPTSRNAQLKLPIS
jgi:hypothetical protein